MIARYEAVCFDLYGTLVNDDGTAISGAREALALLPVERWCIVTSCGSAFARRLIVAAGLPLPKLLVGAESVARGKPAPDPYALAVGKLGLHGADAIVVEDSGQGIASGRAAGLDVIAILNGRGPAFAREASFHVEHFADVQWRVAEDGAIELSF
jgi:beta-phosphoglucomutase-like phosphatase (HAD superfamily)